MGQHLSPSTTADGAKLAAVASGAGSRYWLSISSSADGTELAAAADGTRLIAAGQDDMGVVKIYSSSNAGTTWSPSASFASSFGGVSSVVVSADCSTSRWWARLA